MAMQKLIINNDLGQAVGEAQLMSGFGCITKAALDDPFQPPGSDHSISFISRSACRLI
jgi:hypothetical protein